MANGHNSRLKKVVKEIREEAARQIRGFPSELRRQTTGGSGQEFGAATLWQPPEDAPRSKIAAPTARVQHDSSWS